MFQIRRWIKNFLSLSHAQANGIIVLIPILIVVLFSARVWHWYISHQPVDYSKDYAKLDSLVALWDLNDSTSKRQQSEPLLTDPPHLFRFNPNISSTAQLKALGFSEIISDRILRYRDKGGKFRVRGDLLKIYGMDSALYRRLSSYVDLPAQSKLKIESRPSRKFENNRPGRDIRVSREPEVSFDVNIADTAQLKKVRGIGEKLSMRIIKYRDALGGFVNLDQLSEVYGLDSAVIDRMRKSSFVNGEFVPKRLNINAAGADELNAHPYLTGPEARAIVAYRFQHGKFTSFDDLRQLQLLNEKTFEKIKPYLTITTE